MSRHTVKSSCIVLSLETDCVDPNVCWRERESAGRGSWTNGVGKGNERTEKGEEGDKRMGWKVKRQNDVENGLVSFPGRPDTGRILVETDCVAPSVAGGRGRVHVEAERRWEKESGGRATGGQRREKEAGRRKRER